MDLKQMTYLFPGNVPEKRYEKETPYTFSSFLCSSLFHFPPVGRDFIHVILFRNYINILITSLSGFCVKHLCLCFTKM